jgi:murein DD-endopeptidase MepM/ murein hydrolase activator NlpD
VLVGAPKGLGRFVWPTQGIITQRFMENGHRGLDIAAYMGAPIYASDAGAVTYSGPLGGYGLCVIIDHGNGFQTLYGHLSVYYPRVGQSVKRGQAIGKMGSTGNSTGPHLHFEVTLWGGLVNPAAYLP